MRPCVCVLALVSVCVLALVSVCACISECVCVAGECVFVCVCVCVCVCTSACVHTVEDRMLVDCGGQQWGISAMRNEGLLNPPKLGFLPMPAGVPDTYCIILQ